MGNEQTANKLTETAVQMLVKSSGKSEDEIRRWYNEFNLQTNNTNRMNRRQFQTFYCKLTKNPKVEQIIDHIFRAFDANHSGSIDFAEFLVGYIATTEGTTQEKLEYVFEVYDINDDQLIDKKEARKILALICRILGISDQEVDSYTESLMCSFDTNQDRVLTKKEFIDGCLRDPTLGKFCSPFHFY